MEDGVVNKTNQLDIADRLQDKLLLHMEKLLDDGTITSTDIATITRMLLANGWSLDRNRLPQGLRDKLTAHVDPEDLSDEAGVIPFQRRAG